MTKARVIGVIVVLLCAMSQGVFAEGVVSAQPNLFMAQTVSLSDFQSKDGVRLIIDLLPASVLSSRDLDGFEISHTTPDGLFTETETSESRYSWMPNLRGGLSFDIGPAYIEPTVGGGYLVNAVFTTPMLMGDVACRFKLGDAITLGPHIGLISFTDPSLNDWDDIADRYIDDSRHQKVDAELKDTTGYMAGLALTMGGETVTFSASIDYISAKFDVENGRYWTANTDELDMSGWAANLGLAFRF